MDNGKQYAIFKRKGGKFYYAQFKKSDGTWTNAVSTKETAKTRAEAWCVNYLQENAGRIIDNNRVTFQTFSGNFFDWKGEWATDKRATGKRLSERQCIENQRITDRLLMPVFGDLRLNDIDKNVIKSFRNDLFNKGLSGSLINKALCNLNTILNSAYDKDLIKAIPKVEKVSNKVSKIKGVLTIEETKKLFSITWPDFVAYAMNITAASTGLRRGELLALQIKNFHGEYLDIEKSYDQIMKQLNSTTKNGRTRRVIIPGTVQQVLKKLIDINPYRKPDSFIFFSETPERPIHGEYVNACLYRAMSAIGISKTEREERHITFHSWRVAFNSWLINGRVPLAKVMSLTGHLSREMAEDTYFRTDDLQDVKQIQESIFDTPLLN